MIVKLIMKFLHQLKQHDFVIILLTMMQMNEIFYIKVSLLDFAFHIKVHVFREYRVIISLQSIIH